MSRSSVATPLQYVARVRYGMGQPPPLTEEGGVPIIRATNIERGRITTRALQRAHLADLPLDRAPLLQAGEILVVRSGAYTGDSALVSEAWAGSAPGYDLRVTPGSGVDPRFLSWCLLSRYCLDQLDLLKARAAQPHLNAEELSSLQVPSPPLAVQRRIADYLDTETARIDRMLAKNDELLALGAERWRSRVEHRLSSSGPMGKLQYVADLTPGYAYPSSDFDDAGEYRLLRGVNVGTGSLRWDDVVYASSTLVAGTPQYSLLEGDLVFGMDRPWISSGLRAARVEARDLPCFLVQRVLRIRPHVGQLDADFLLLWLQTGQFFADFEPEMTGISVPHVSCGQVGAARVPVPRVDLQRRIAEELNHEQLALRRVESAVGLQSSLLRERRQALITAAVTGELEV